MKILVLVRCNGKIPVSKDKNEDRDRTNLLF